MEPEAYPGAEDTHLLIDILKQDEAALQRKVEDGGIVIEIGYVSERVTVY